MAFGACPRKDPRSRGKNRGHGGRRADARVAPRGASGGEARGGGGCGGYLDHRCEALPPGPRPDGAPSLHARDRPAGDRGSWTAPAGLSSPLLRLTALRAHQRLRCAPARGLPK
jgi:hypothetical protein